MNRNRLFNCLNPIHGHAFIFSWINALHTLILIRLFTHNSHLHIQYARLNDTTYVYIIIIITKKRENFHLNNNIFRHQTQYPCHWICSSGLSSWLFWAFVSFTLTDHGLFRYSYYYYEFIFFYEYKIYLRFEMRMWKWINDFIETTKDLLIYFKLKRKMYTKGNMDLMLHLIRCFALPLCSDFDLIFIRDFSGLFISCTFYSFVSCELCIELMHVLM